ncbi:S9 family peptidase [Candidatus Nitronereus thalassa]|uniref:S9 family peptidase n=1 Tax=Candidatus Nitronereus thalassa TaxID=3020898 RepID=A0ABU3K787_9BACT|nr:S9 family peptidase [Candidatus Nitronereus thalassa]MDT7042243.1 S9 family peptidase [Candidatus Nitronereus thalassa]
MPSRVAPYGSWESPLTSDRIVSESIKLGQMTVDQDQVYWIESRPSEGGRSAIVRQNRDGRQEILTPPPFNVRTRVHEYGGAPYLVSNGIMYFSNFSDQRLFRQLPGQPPTPLTPEASIFYADGIYDQTHNRLIYIQEDHTASDQEPINTISSIPLHPEDKPHLGTTLVSGNDFYASPRLSPNGRQLAWLTWNHPNMPWDGTELWIADIQSDGTLTQARRIAGGPNESIFQPEWSREGFLYFVSDKSGWWNLYRWQDEQASSLCPMEAEFGLPQWVFGQRLYGFESPSRIICAYTRKGIWYLARLDLSTEHLETFDLPYTDFDQILVRGSQVFCTASSPVHPNSIIRFDLNTQQITTLRQSTDFTIDETFVSIPTAIEYPAQDGSIAHAFYYPPHNANFQAPTSERPPLLVKSHGGPTSAASTSFNLMIQFWTSRGFAVLDVNYGGSTGYGRAYRERLNGQWGIVDVDDCVGAVQYLINQEKVDPSRVTITGGSAGGYTTLCALTFRDCFTAGSSYYGVSDLEALVRDTHKFESRYLDGLIGPFPERKDLYDQRSPIYFTDRLSCPLILFQGLEDRVVPPNQAEKMFEAVKAKGLPVAYIAFEGEQHGFRKSENIKRVLDNELFFYAKIFAFEPADTLAPFAIENL